MPWLLVLGHQNRYTAQPASLRAAAFFRGGLAATCWTALPADTALLEIWTKLGGTAFAADWTAGLTAPTNEEFARWCCGTPRGRNASGSGSCCSPRRTPV